MLQNSSECRKLRQPRPLASPRSVENLEREGSNMVAWPFDRKALPRSGGEKSLDSQFKIVAEAFLESFELLEEYAPIWYTEQHHRRALTAWRILQTNPSQAIGSERHRASQPCK